jgi:cytochrome c oxidase subunit IV
MTHVSKTTYTIIWVALMVLLLATWAAAQVNLGVFNNVVALAIAFSKMSLVLLFFMHVKYEKRLVWVFVAAGFIWLFIMIGYAMGDYLTRSSTPWRWHQYVPVPRAK